MDISYYVLDPAGNRTILVDTPVLPGSMPFTASRLMDTEPDTEQVGFLSCPEDGCLSLRMAGGEFCGNASLCAAVLAAVKAGVSEHSLELPVSGAAKPVPVHVEKQPDGSWTGSVVMPSPDCVETIDLPKGGLLPVVRFDGISHVILEKDPEKSKAEDLIREWCRLLGADALGLMFLDKNAGRLTPLVYVPAVNTLCWENSCASGTTAVGAWLSASFQKPMDMSLLQPGGSLAIEVSSEGRLTLTGCVKLIRHSFLNL